MKKLILSAMAFAVIATSGSAQVLFSEYIEGSSFNKAVEIINLSGAAINLTDIEIRRYNNGAATPSTTWSPAGPGTLADGDVLVICHASANASIMGKSDIVDTDPVNFNGDDALELYVSAVLQDSFGQVGFDPGSQWTGTGAGAATANATLVRMNTTADTNSGDAYDPDAYWTAFASDTDTDLGIGTVPVELSSFDLE